MIHVIVAKDERPQSGSAYTFEGYRHGGANVSFFLSDTPLGGAHGHGDGGALQASGLLAKTVTTLDVLSGGRAWLGIGSGHYEEQTRGLGIPFPPQRERFEMLEETVQI